MIPVNLHKAIHNCQRNSRKWVGGQKRKEFSATCIDEVVGSVIEAYKKMAPNTVKVLSGSNTR